MSPKARDSVSDELADVGGRSIDTSDKRGSFHDFNARGKFDKWRVKDFGESNR